MLKDKQPGKTSLAEHEALAGIQGGKESLWTREEGIDNSGELEGCSEACSEEIKRAKPNEILICLSCKRQ